MGQYKDLTSSPGWHDLKEWLADRLELCRDQLEGFQNRGSEEYEKIRGRCAEIRDILSFVDSQVEEEEEQDAAKRSGSDHNV